MNDETDITSPAKKKLKQLTVMESFSKSSGCPAVGFDTLKKDHCTVEIEPAGCEPQCVTSTTMVGNTCSNNPELGPVELPLISEGSQTAVIFNREIVAVEETVLYAATASVAMLETTPRICTWKGKPLSAMQSLLSSPCYELEEVVPGRNHVVLFQVPVQSVNSAPLPYPAKFDDRWDPDHVKMPCSPHNLYPVTVNGSSSLEQRWTLITEAYQKGISNSLELEKAILSYNGRYNQIWDFKGFHHFIDKALAREESGKFFSRILPGIIELAVRTPERLTRPPILLVRQKAQSLSLSQSQIASLLANAFLNTYPRRNTQKKQSEFSSYPDINFIKMFENKSKARHVHEKLKCLLNYFDRVIQQEPTGTVTFTRRVVNDTDFPNWDIAQETLGGFHVSSEGTIEKEGMGFLQMDFANRFIGGGVLNWGCVQEEIRFIICPELIASCLFTEMMEPNEALVITGCEQYCRHSGYSNTFRFEGDYVDTTPRDSYGRRLCQLVAVDAVQFRRKEVQYQKEFLKRELNKAYAGFHYPRRGEQAPKLVAVATGNWGCGAYQGDPRLKCLLQLMAAAVAGRDLVYFTFGDQQLRDDVFAMYSLITEKKLTVGTLYTLLCQYGEQFGDSQSPALDLYGYLYAVLDSMDDTESSDL